MRAEFAYKDIGGKPSMPHLRNLIQQGKAIPFSAYAHAPTVTLPRIKAIITGGIPSFIDYVGNLNSPELLEDNLIYQLSRAGKRMVFYGDETWLKLFPSAFQRHDGTTSFFVSVRPIF
jgi:ethanolamine phosphate transferase 2 subunit G